MTSASNNRSITLGGANKIFGVLDIKITQHELGHYMATWHDREFAAKTLTALCQDLLKFRDAGEMQRDRRFLAELKNSVEKGFNDRDVTHQQHALEMINDWIGELDQKLTA